MPPKNKIPGPIPREALAFLAAKGLKPSFNYTDVWREEHDVSFTVAKIMETDILRTIHESLIEALEQGIPLEEWRRSVKEVLDRSGWTKYNKERSEQHRTKIIYQTNMRSARAVGQWKRVQKTKATQPYLLYGLGPSARHRPVHEGWAGLKLHVDDPFWDEAYPPNGYGCKCHVTQINERRLKRLGGVSRTPKRTTDLWTDPQGKVHRVRRGVQPGFDHNAGKQRQREKQLAKVGAESKRQARNVSRKLKRRSTKL
jgi:SPP1 gp7 family putative phage head morphogenesis protein